MHGYAVGGVINSGNQVANIQPGVLQAVIKRQRAVLTAAPVKYAGFDFLIAEGKRVPLLRGRAPTMRLQGCVIRHVYPSFNNWLTNAGTPTVAFSCIFTTFFWFTYGILGSIINFGTSYLT